MYERLSGLGWSEEFRRVGGALDPIRNVFGGGYHCPGEARPVCFTNTLGDIAAAAGCTGTWGRGGEAVACATSSGNPGVIRCCPPGVPGHGASPAPAQAKVSLGPVVQMVEPTPEPAPSPPEQPAVRPLTQWWFWLGLSGMVGLAFIVHHKYQEHIKPWERLP